MKTTLSIILLLIGTIALMAEPIDDQAEQYPKLLIATKVVMLLAYGGAMLLNNSKKEEREFLNKQSAIESGFAEKKQE